MAVRSFNIRLFNQTGWPLTLTNYHVEGMWSDNLQAPKTVAKGNQIEFQSESDGILTGTSGNVIYQVMDNDDGAFEITSWIYISWDNPFEFGTTKLSNCFISTIPVDNSGNPVNATGGSSTFIMQPALSPYQTSTGFLGQDDTPAGTNWGALVPGNFGPVTVFANVSIMPHATWGVLVDLKPPDLLGWSKQHGRDVSKGVRALNPPNGSLRALLQLPILPVKRSAGD